MQNLFISQWLTRISEEGSILYHHEIIFNAVALNNEILFRISLTRFCLRTAFSSFWLFYIALWSFWRGWRTGISLLCRALFIFFGVIAVWLLYLWKRRFLIFIFPNCVYSNFMGRRLGIGREKIRNRKW